MPEPVLAIEGVAVGQIGLAADGAPPARLQLRLVAPDDAQQAQRGVHGAGPHRAQGRAVSANTRGSRGSHDALVPIAYHPSLIAVDSDKRYAISDGRRRPAREICG